MIEHSEIEKPMALDVMKESLHELNRLIFMRTIDMESIDKMLIKMKLLPAAMDQQKYNYLNEAKQGLKAAIEEMESKRELVVEKIIKALPDHSND